MAAAEVVAAHVAMAKEENPSPATPHQIIDWISKNRVDDSPELVRRRLPCGGEGATNSELKDLWLEAEGLNEWSAALRDLEARLRASDHLAIGSSGD